MSDIITHVGVKGMRWGKRKDRSSVEKVSRRTQLESEKIRKGSTAEAAAKSVDRRIKIEKVLAITAGVTLAAVTAAVVTRYIGREYVDVKLKKGLALQHVTSLPKMELDTRPVFTTFTKGDKRDINALFTKPFAVSLKTKTDVTAPSNFKARKMLTEVLGKAKTMSRKEYAQFNHEYFYRQDEPGRKLVVDQFFNKIKEAGYNSVLDPKPGGYYGGRLQKPLIVLDGVKNVVQTRHFEVSDAAVIKAKKIVAAKGLVKLAAASHRAIIFGAGVTGVTGILAINADVLARRQAVAVQKYLKKNPGTTLTRSEILAKIPQHTI